MKLESKFDFGQEVYFLTNGINFEKGTISVINFYDTEEDGIEYSIETEDEDYYEHILERNIFRKKEEYIEIFKRNHKIELNSLKKDFKNKLKYAIENAEKQYEKNLKAIEEMEF